MKSKFVRCQGFDSCHKKIEVIGNSNEPHYCSFMKNADGTFSAVCAEFGNHGKGK